MKAIRSKISWSEEERDDIGNADDLTPWDEKC